MNFGDDYVAARLSIDIPEGSSEGIREITQEVERFRVTLEAAAHTEGDMTRYLDQMTEAAKRAGEVMAALAQQQQAYASMPGGIGGGSGVPQGGFQQPFAGMSAGMGGMSPGGVFLPGTRTPNASDVAAHLGAAQGSNPREWLNMQSARGGLTAQDVVNISPQSIQDLANKIADREQTAREQVLHTQAATGGHPSAAHGSGSATTSVEGRVQRATNMAGQVINEMAPGGSALGMGAMAVRGLQWAARRSAQAGTRPHSSAAAPTSTSPEGMPPEGAPGTGGQPAEGAPAAQEDDALSKGTGGLAGMTKMLGPIAGVATAALSIFGVIQKGGGMIQGMRNVASMRGGAAGEGFQVEAKARMLSMNPFITQDQARQIYQAVMSEGYSDASGAGADNVIDFMKTNLTSMNVSVADSAKMLRSTIVGNVRGDPHSVAGSVSMLRQELDSIRTLSRQSVISTPDYTKGVMALQGTLTAAGASPAEAARSAIGAEEVGSQDQASKGQFASAVGDMAGSASGGAMLRVFGGVQTPAGLLPQGTGAYLAHTGQLDQAVWNTLRHFAQEFSASDRGDWTSRYNAVARFQMIVKRVAPDHAAANDHNAAEKLYLDLLGNKEMGAAQQRANAVQMPTSSGGLGDESGGGGGGGFTPSQPPALNTPSAPESPGTGSSGSPAPSVAPARSDVRVSGSTSVQIGLTPEAARAFSVVGGDTKTAALTSTQKGANAGHGGVQVNAPGSG